MIVVGIDPGLTGAVAWLEVDLEGRVRLLGVEDMPTFEVKSGKTTKNRLNLPGFAALFTHQANPSLHPDKVYQEQVGAAPGQNVAAMFNFGFTAGATAGTVTALGYPLEFITPKAWQGAAKLRQGKDGNRQKCSELFPTYAHFFQRKKDHGRADAVLIALAGIKLEKGA